MAALQNIIVPDIGGASHVDVIEILVKPGDSIDKETPLVTLESDKATMEIPSPAAGIVSSIAMKVGDKVSEGDLILMFSPELAEERPDEDVKKEASTSNKADEMVPPQQEEIVRTQMTDEPARVQSDLDSNESFVIPAGPSARRLARTLGVNLTEVHGSGRKDRINKEDIEQFVKDKLSKVSAAGAFHVPSAPSIDFSKFGDIEVKPLSKIKRLTGVSVHRSWVTIPHVTQFDSADITELEAFRKSESKVALEQGYKLTLLAFVCKVLAKALAVFPQFNSSLDASFENVIYKQYYNIGIAVETPNGLVVAVIKDVDRLSVGDIAKEMARLSSKARDKGLSVSDMSGGCFTISSLGGIGGHAFTPIVNSPEVAILGLSRATIQPVYQESQFVPRLLLPLSLSYDHRVIDGAEAARFTNYVSECLSDIRRILL